MDNELKGMSTYQKKRNNHECNGLEFHFSVIQCNVNETRGCEVNGLIVAHGHTIFKKVAIRR